MKRIFKRSVREVKNGFRWVDVGWQKFNRAKDDFLFSLAKYIPKCITPNQLSWTRIGSACLMTILLFQYEKWKILIVGLFIASVAGDLLDGPIARRRHLESQRGAFLDRVGDKLLVCPLVARLLWRSDKVLVSMLAGSEAISLTLAILAIRRNVSTKSNWCGKWKMFCQSAGVIVLFFLPQKIGAADKILWAALGLGLASLISHFQSYVGTESRKA